MYTEKPKFKVLIVGCDNAGKTTLLEQIKKTEGMKHMNLEKIPPTVGLNIARVVRPNAEFMFWDVGGQKKLRRIWTKYFAECNGVIFLVDGSDESRFDEVREVIDDLYERRALDEAGIPIIEKVQKGSGNKPIVDNDDLEGGGGADDDTTVDILKRLPCLFLLNKNDKKEFKGADYIQNKLGIKEINCVDTVSLPMSALDMNGIDAALNWIYKSVSQNA